MRGVLSLAALACVFVSVRPARAQEAPPPAALAAPSAKGPGAADLATAYDHFQKKEYAQAAAYYSKALAAAPDDADALLGLAWSRLDMGEYWAAKKLFEQVLSVYPGNASAQEGLKYIPAKPFSVTAGYNYAWIKYSHIAFKNRAYSYNIPVTLAYKDLWTLGMAYTYTVIHFNPSTFDALQREFNPSGSLNIGKHLTLNAAYDYLMVNDIATDSGKVTTGGFTVHHYDPDSTIFLSAGGYESYSAYRPFRVVQHTPHVGLGWSKIYTDFYALFTNIDKNNERLASYGGNVNVGPFWGLSANVAGYTGDKRLPVENWGTTIYNNQDLYRRGWKGGLSYAYKGLTAFASYAIDNVNATVATVRGPLDFPYTTMTAVAGLTYKY